MTGQREEFARDPAGERGALELFAQLAEAPQEQRDRLLESCRSGNPGLHERVQELLHHDRVKGDFLSASIASHWNGAVQGCRIEGSTPPGEAQLEAGDPEPLLVPGERLGDYVIESYLAGGGQGEVYRARQVSLDRRVALKVLPAVRIGPGDRERFLRGARAIGQLHHPHLVEVYGCGEDPERQVLFYSMRLVDGATVQDLLRQLAQSGPPDAASTRTILARFQEAAAALGELHARGLVHRDVKPVNLMVEHARPGSAWRGKCVLVDYELLRALDSDQALWTRWVSPAYAAPEQLRGEAIDARADVFSLGVCLHDVLAARLPAQRTARAEDGLEPLSTLVPGIDRDLEALVDRAVSPTPHLRYQDGAGLTRDLAAWSCGDPVSARRLTRAERARRWVRRNPGRLLGWIVRGSVASLLVSLATIGILSLVEFQASAVSLRACWARGDLLHLEAGLARLPAPLDGWFFSGPLREVVREIRTRSPSSPVGEIATRLCREHPLLFAARYLERDGWRAHPELARLYEWALESDDESARAVRLLGMLFFERPDASIDDTELSAGIREQLMHALDDSRIPDRERLYALTALAGCGAAETIPRVMEWVERRGEAPFLREELRLVLRCLGMITRRSERCGFRDALLGLDWDPLLARAAKAVLEIEPNPFLDHSAALEDLFTCVAMMLRTAGLETPSTRAPSLVRPFISYRGACRDPVLAQELRDVARLRGWIEERTAAHSIEEIGRAAGLMGDPELVEFLRGHLTSISAVTGEAFERGLAGATSTDVPPAWAPDPDSRLGAALERRDPGYDDWDTLPTGGPGGAALARWTFEGGQARTWGLARAIQVRATLLEGDPMDATDHYARLGVFGNSEVLLHFALPELRCIPSLRLSFQNGRRTQLPFDGEALIRITLDGTTLLGNYYISASSGLECDIPLSQQQGTRSREHCLSILLEPSSTTTFRIYAAEIRGFAVPAPEPAPSPR